MCEIHFHNHGTEPMPYLDAFPPLRRSHLSEDAILVLRRSILKLSLQLLQDLDVRPEGCNIPELRVTQKIPHNVDWVTTPAIEDLSHDLAICIIHVTSHRNLDVLPLCAGTREGIHST